MALETQSPRLKYIKENSRNGGLKMHQANELLIELHEKNVLLGVKSGRLLVESPAGVSEADRIKLQQLEPQLVGLLKRMDIARYVPVSPRATQGRVPLAPLQLTYFNYLLGQSAGMSSRLSTCAVRIVGPLDVSALRRSIDAVVSRHESLRTQIVVVDHEPHQRVSASCSYEWELVDLSHLSSDAAKVELQRHCERALRARINILGDPYFAVKLIRVSLREHVLVLALEHMITDGESNGILIREMWEVYKHAIRGGMPELPKLPVQYPDYSVWLQQTRGAWLHAHERYWRGRLQGTRYARLPLGDESAGAVAATLEVSLGEVLTDQLRALSRKERVPSSMTVLALYVFLMSRWCGMSDVVVAVAANGRYGADLKQMIGFISHAIFLRVEIFGADTFTELLRRVAVEYRCALAHPTFGWISTWESWFGTDLFFNWLPRHGAQSLEACRAPGGAAATAILPFTLIPTHAWRFALFFCEDEAGVIGASITYSSDLSESVDRFARNLRSVAEMAARDPCRPLASVETL